MPEPGALSTSQRYVVFVGVAFNEAPK